MSRNTAVGEWRERERRVYRFDDDKPGVATLIVEQADMLDKKLGSTYVGGSYRVRLTNVPNMRTKTFYGETAWSRAASYAADAASACGDWRWWPDL